jgi:hypothetical protein
MIFAPEERLRRISLKEVAYKNGRMCLNKKIVLHTN